MRIGQVFNHVKKYYDVRGPNDTHILVIGQARQHVETGTARMRGGLVGQFDACNVKAAFGLLEKKPIGATDLHQLPVWAETADELDTACELAPKHRLGAEIIGIAIAALPGKVFACIIRAGVEAGGYRAPKPASLALPNVAFVDPVPKRMVNGCGTCGA